MFSSSSLPVIHVLSRSPGGIENKLLLSKVVGCVVSAASGAAFLMGNFLAYSTFKMGLYLGRIVSMTDFAQIKPSLLSLS